MEIKTKRSKLEASRLHEIEPGKEVWAGGIGYRRNSTGTGGTWSIRYRAPKPGSYPEGMDPPKRLVRERLHSCANMTEAAGVLAERKGAVFNGTYRPKKKVDSTTLEDFVPTFLSEKRHLRSVSKYEQQLRDYIVPALGTKPLVALSREDCQNFYHDRLDKISTSTANGELACLKSLLSLAVEKGRCAANPAYGVKVTKPNNHRDRILSPDETDRLFEAADTCNEFVRPFFYLCYYTGARRDEILRLRWSDIEFGNQRLIIRESKTGEGRDVPMASHLIRELRRWKHVGGPSQWVLPKPSDLSERIAAIYNGWESLCRQAEVEGVTPHTLRHNLVSRLQAHGVAPRVVMDITGHKCIQTLMRYSHATRDHRQAAVELMDGPRDKAPVVSIADRRAG